CPGLQLSARKTENLGRVGGEHLYQTQQRHVAGVIQAKGGSQHGLKADCTHGSFREGLTLGVHVLRVMRGDDDVELTVLQRLDHSNPIILGSEWRRETEEGAVFANIIL